MMESDKNTVGNYDISDFQKVCDELVFKSGETIFKEGDKNNDFYIIQKGDVEIRKKTSDGSQKVLAQLTSGEIVGEGALTGQFIKPASAIAVGQVSLLKVSADHFNGLVEKDPKAAVKFLTSVLGSVSSRLTVTNSKLMALFEMGQIADMDSQDMKAIAESFIDKLLAITESEKGALLLKNQFSNDYRLLFSTDEAFGIFVTEKIDPEKIGAHLIDDTNCLVVEIISVGSLVLSRKTGGIYDISDFRLVMLVSDLISYRIKEAQKAADEKAKSLLDNRVIEF